MTHFWIPRTRILEPKDAIQLPQVRIGGMVRAIRIGPDGKERWRSPWSKNLWTDPGLNWWFGLTLTEVAYGEVGTGSAAPTPADTALQVRVAQSTGVGSFQTNDLVDPGGGLPFYGFETRRYTFNPVGVSHNLAEFGIRFTNAGTGVLGVRSLFRDAGGAPTTVTWVAGETLLVDHQIRYYGSPADLTGQLTMGTSNVVHNLLLRPASVLGVRGFINNNPINNFQFNPPISVQYHSITPYTDVTNLGAYTASITGNGLVTGTETILAYTPGSFFREMQSVWGPTQANTVNGIQAFLATASPGNHKVQFTPAIMKTSLDTLTMVFSSPVWSRYTP
jgi:hypothetical protein